MSNKKYQVGHVSFKPYQRGVPCDAINPQAKSGAKAGNPLIDKINEQLIEEEIANKIKSMKKILLAQMPYIRHNIEKIINSHINSAKQIDNLLDVLLGILPIGYGKKEFKRLNSYYFTINRRNSKAYSRFYEEVIKW